MAGRNSRSKLSIEQIKQILEVSDEFSGQMMHLVVNYKPHILILNFLQALKGIPQGAMPGTNSHPKEKSNWSISGDLYQDAFNPNATCTKG